MKAGKPKTYHLTRTMLTAMSELYAYIFCMLASRALVGMPIFGGALFMCARVGLAFIAAFAGQTSAYLPPRAKPWRKVLLAVLLLMDVCVLVLYPIRLDSGMMWILFAVVLLMLLRDAMSGRLMRVSVSGGMEEKRFVLLLTGLQLLPLGAIMLILLYNLPGETAWFILGGYVLCNGMSLYTQLKEREGVGPAEADADPDRVQAMQEALRKAHAYTAYETLSTFILIALEMTLVVLYSFLAISTEQVLTYMVLAALVMIAVRELAEALLRRRERRGRHADPTNMLLVGLFLWLYGLMLFNRMLRSMPLQIVNVYICLGLCTAGATLCVTCLTQMEKTMAAVARFAAGGDAPFYRQMRSASLELSTLLGQMLALVALTALCFVAGQDLPRDVVAIADSFQPVMVVPAILTVLGALLSVLRFPLSGRYMEKLSRFLHLKDAGGDNPALEKQLEAVVVQRHRQPFATRAVMALLRPFYRHELKGVENIVQDDDNPIVFLCNHGEFYGPIVGMLYIPVPIRPWTISEITVDKDEVAAYVYRYTISRQRWLPEFLKWPIARLIGPVSVWAMNQLESIPVFRNKPRELMTTFRRSVEAMQAGDNLLIFPENPNAVAPEHGYERAGVGELFSGFAMLAPIYYNKTGKRCRFLPMFAHKGLRTLSFGHFVEYDPDNQPGEERDRIVREVTEQMQALSEREEALYRQRHARAGRDVEM